MLVKLSKKKYLYLYLIYKEAHYTLKQFLNSAENYFVMIDMIDSSMYKKYI